MDHRVQPGGDEGCGSAKAKRRACGSSTPIPAFARSSRATRADPSYAGLTRVSMRPHGYGISAWTTGSSPVVTKGVGRAGEGEAPCLRLNTPARLSHAQAGLRVLIRHTR